MPPEGMVHALHRAAALVAADGRLVDMHPTPATPHLTAFVPDGAAVYVGPLDAEDARVRHARADAALAEALANGIVALEGTRTFTFCRVSDTLDELLTYVGGTWNGRFDAATLERARA